MAWAVASRLHQRAAVLVALATWCLARWWWTCQHSLRRLMWSGGRRWQVVVLVGRAHSVGSGVVLASSAL